MGFETLQEGLPSDFALGDRYGMLARRRETGPYFLRDARATLFDFLVTGVTWLRFHPLTMDRREPDSPD